VDRDVAEELFVMGWKFSWIALLEIVGIAGASLLLRFEWWQVVILAAAVGVAHVTIEWLVRRRKRARGAQKG